MRFEPGQVDRIIRWDPGLFFFATGSPDSDSMNYGQSYLSDDESVYEDTVVKNIRNTYLKRDDHGVCKHRSFICRIVGLDLYIADFCILLDSI